MDEKLRIIALNAGLEHLLEKHPDLVEAASKRARIYAEKLEPLNLSDEPAHIYWPAGETPASE